MNMQNLMKNRFLVVVLLILIFLTFTLNSLLKPKSNLLLEVSPRVATVIVDGKSKTGAGNVYLEPGKHAIKATMSGFTDQVQDVTTTKSGKVELVIILVPSSSVGTDWLAAHYSESMYRESLASKSISSNSNKTKTDLPLLKELPYIGAGFEFRVDYGVATDNSSVTQIIITAPDSQSQQDALTWIKSKGYDPAAYNIRYVTSQP